MCLTTGREALAIAAAACGDGASKMAAATGFAHRMRLVAALHSQTGVGLRACAASRESFSQPNWNLGSLIASVTRITPNKALIRLLQRQVHDAGPADPCQAGLTLIFEGVRR